MQWHYTPYILPLVMNALGLAILASLAGLVWRRRSASSALPLMVLLLAALVWSLAYVAEMGGTTLGTKFFWNRVGYTAAVYLPTMWLIFIFRYIGWREWMRFRFHVLLAVEPTLATLLLWTNELHRLFYTAISLDAGGPFPTLGFSYGPLFVLHMVYSSTLIVVGLSLLFGTVFRLPRLHRRPMWIMLTGATVPWVLALFCTLGFVPPSFLNLTPVFFTVMGLIAIRSLFRFRLLDIMPTVREAIFESMGDGVIVLDLEGHIADLNPAAQQMVGRTIQESFGQPIEQALSDWSELAEHCRRSAPSHAEIAHGEGAARRYYDLRASPLYDPRGNLTGRMAILRDMTETRRSEERYRLLVENIPIPIYRTAPGPTGEFLMANPAFLNLFGFTSEEELRRVSVADLYATPAERQAFSANLLAHGSVAGVELWLKKRDGTTLCGAVTARVVCREASQEVAYFDCLMEDITERKRAEESLRESEQRYQTLAETSPTGIFRTDAQGRTTYVNPRWCEISGLDPSEALGDGWLRAVHPDDTRTVAFRWGETVQTAGMSRAEYRFLRPDGSTAWVIGQAVPETDSEGHVVGYVGTITDITERKRTEEVLRQRTAQLEALREMALNLTAELDLTALLNSIAARAVELLGGSSGGLYICRPGRDELEWVVAVGVHIDPVGSVLHRGEGLAGKVWESGQPLFVDDYTHWEGRATLYNGYAWDAVVGVPVRWGDEFLGVLVVIADAPRVFSPADADLLSLFAPQAAIAIRNAHLFQAEREQRALAEALTEAATVVSGTLDLEQVLDRILAEVARVVSGDAFTIMLIDGEHVRPVRWRGYERFGAAQIIADTIFRLTDTPVLHQMAESGKSAVVADTATYPGWIEIPRMEWLRAYVAAPIQVGGRTVGFLDVNGARPGQFGPDDARRLEAFASHAAAAIKNARLYQETIRRLAQTQVLRETMLAAARTLDFDQVLERTLETLQETMRVEFLSFGFFDRENNEIRVHTARIGYPAVPEQVPLDRSVCGRVFQTGEPLILEDVRQVPFYLEGHPDVRSELVVPVRAGQQAIGVLDVESRQLNGFDRDDLAFYTAIAGQLGVALENARLYQEVSQALAQLQQLDRMKDEFIQNVSHELRMPLSLIRGHAEMLENGGLGELNGDQEQSVSIIARRSRMMGTLVDDITLILESEARRVRREPVALNELVRVAAEDFRAVLAQGELTLHTEIAPDLPPVAGSPVHLRRVADNLIGNAIKFTPPQGTITVRVWRDGDMAALQVQDTGIGIPADQLDRIFERFFQVDGSLKRRYGGVGLGLALVKEITEAYGGRVEVQSQVGAGSTFTAWFPLAG